MDIKISETFRNLVPPQSTDEHELLEASILNDGYDTSYPIIIWNNTLIDGHNRYEICKKHNVPFTTSEKQFDNEHDVINWIIDNQLSRRNINEYQRTYLIGKRYQAEKKEVGENQYTETKEETKRGGQSDHPKKTDQKIAEQTKVSPKTVRRAEKFANAVDKVAENVGIDSQNILSGDIKATSLEIKEVTKLEPDQQRRVFESVLNKNEPNVNKAINRIKTEDKKDADKARTTAVIESIEEDELKPIIYQESAFDFLNRYDNNSVDLLITDPPYITDVKDIKEFIDSWLITALQKVKDTGRAFIFVGAYPEELNAYLYKLLEQKHLIFEDVLVWTYKNTIGPTPKLTFFQNWQAILYLRGAETPVWNTDKIKDLFAVKEFNAPDGRLGDRHYKWQKPTDLIDLLISISTNPGDTVIDCFAGSGTHIISASTLARKGYGCEIDTDPFNIAISRGCVKQ